MGKMVQLTLSVDTTCTDDLLVSTSTTSAKLPSPPLAPVSAASASASTTLRRVRFAEDSTLHVYARNYKKRDERRIWYSPSDLGQIKIDNHTFLGHKIKDIEQACSTDSGSLSTTPFDSADWSWRGFDYILHRLPRKLLRKEHTLSVLQFQTMLVAGSSSSTAGASPAALADYASNSSTANGSIARGLDHGTEDQLASAEIHYAASHYKQEYRSDNDDDEEEEEDDIVGRAKDDDADTVSLTCSEMSSSVLVDYTNCQRKEVVVISRYKKRNSKPRRLLKAAGKFFQCLPSATSPSSAAAAAAC